MQGSDTACLIGLLMRFTLRQGLRRFTELDLFLLTWATIHDYPAVRYLAVAVFLLLNG